MSMMKIEAFERFHGRLLRPVPPRASLVEVIVTMLTGIAVAPFMYVIFMCIPMIGIVTVSFALFVTGLYLFFRKSLLIAASIVLSSSLLAGFFFSVAQGIKYRMDVTLFVLIALGIPVCLIYTTFVGMRIWELRGGVD